MILSQYAPYGSEDKDYFYLLYIGKVKAAFKLANMFNQSRNVIFQHYINMLIHIH